ncbi:F0F1 ATP synthase subunit B [Rhizobium sp. KVB221]|uniref:ATP synthase subunit b n=1 Tax=Rhizobium setariae TaxID=2801340 RepID=A0A936YM66_9HYPH|nr:F0F1 ATP synthase subunit B [Rhizobium setariae]MBL0370751.1 F0F1 ATP synthase subunit B [Rhizobium setariae]
MDATMWAQIWSQVALAIFLGIVIYLKVPGMITKTLDARAVKIAGELDAAKQIREEAQSLLAEYKKKRSEAEAEAAEIVAAAKREADSLAADAKQKTEEYVARRTALSEQKIKQAEADAVNAVRSAAVDLAIAAAEKLIGGNPDAKVADGLFSNAVEQVKTRLN